MRKFHSRNQGIATFVSLVMIAIIGVSVLGLSKLMTMQVRHTQEQAVEAQMRQLLLAGAASAKAHANIDADGQEAWSVPLATELIASGAKLDATLQPRRGATTDAQITATYRGHTTTQRLTFTIQKD